MDAVLTEEQQALAEAAEGLSADGLTGARAMLDGGEAPARPTADLFDGFNGLGLDAGAGGTLVDLAIVARALGRTVCPTPWMAHQLALQAASAAGLDIADGLAAEARWVLVDGDPVAVREGGTATAAVRLDGRTVSLHPVTGATPRRAMDPSRPMADLELGDAIANADGHADAARARVRAVLAAGLTGVGLGAVERAVDYAMQREQFGKVVASFQAVSHQLADAWTGVELAWSLALYACWATEEGREDAAAAVDAAAAKSATAAVFAAERGMQVHGGIGITWEADPHLSLRRAMGDEAWMGGSRRAELALGRAVLAR